MKEKKDFDFIFYMIIFRVFYEIISLKEPKTYVPWFSIRTESMEIKENKRKTKKRRKLKT